MTGGQAERTVINALRMRGQERVSRVKFRTIARAVGMTLPGLDRFLAAGASPAEDSARPNLLSALLEGELRTDEPNAARVRALQAVLEDLPAASQIPGLEALLAEISRQHRMATGDLPLWIGRLRQKLAAVPDARRGCAGGHEIAGGGEAERM